MIACEVVYSPGPRQVDCVEVWLPDGATLLDALRLSGVLQRQGLQEASLVTGIWGRAAPLDAPLRDRDRVEIYRPLQCDPKESRRKRYRQGDRAGARGRRPNGNPKR